MLVRKGKEMKVMVILCNLTKAIYAFGEDIIDIFGDFLEKIFDGITTIILSILWLPFYPFFILNKLLQKSLNFFEMNRNYEKNRKAFLKWYRENKDKLEQEQ